MTLTEHGISLTDPIAICAVCAQPYEVERDETWCAACLAAAERRRFRAMISAQRKDL